MARKVELLMRHFGTQRSKHWFDEETFRGLARLRGMECRAPERYAEALPRPQAGDYLSRRTRCRKASSASSTAMMVSARRKPCPSPAYS